MKKKLMVLMMAMCFVAAAVGCGKKDSDNGTTENADNSEATTKAEIVQMVNKDLPGIASERDSAVAIYNKYFEEGADLDSETWRDQLENDALKSYEAYLEKLNALKYQSPEVETLKDLYTKSAESQKEAIVCVIAAIQDVDTAQLESAQQSISDSQTYLKNYEESLKDLCQKYGIEIKGNFQSSTMTEATTEATTEAPKKSSETDASKTDASKNEASESDADSE
ncbi:MAG: hypothetical protein IKS48_12725 [Eubacterium sp.]|nr:hypothetical protein [Eubacterium sp.]